MIRNGSAKETGFDGTGSGGDALIDGEIPPQDTMTGHICRIEELRGNVLRERKRVMEMKH